jgi:putative oxidoreductase
LQTCHTRARAAADALRWLPLALARVTLGFLFVTTGWGKIHHLDKVTSFFIELGIPAPGFFATLVAWSEFLCGALLVVGLLSRLAAIPLIVTMIVALLTAKRDEIHGLADLVGQIEFTYLVLLIVVAVLGAGTLSVDAAVGRGLLRLELIEPATRRP